MARPANRLCISAAAALALIAVNAATDTSADTGAYYQLHYAYEVSSYCGLVSPDVERAFRQGRRRLSGAMAEGSSVLRAQRIAAIVAAEREYQNRGLGGYRAWCAKEGRAAARWIITRPQPD